MAIEPTLRPISVAEYYRMAEVGILRPDERVELLDGVIFTKASISPRHAACTRRLTRQFIEQLGRRGVVSVRNPVLLDDFTEPEPDLCLARWRDDGYSTAHPRPADVHLVVEIASTSMEFDRAEKLPRYARSAIPEVWIVDLVGTRLEVFRSPRGTDYMNVVTLVPGETVAPAAFPDLSIQLDEILGGL